MSDDTLIARALAILSKRMRVTDSLNSPAAVRDYLRLLLAGREYEVFVVVLLDAQNRVLSCEELFRGTLTQTSVYPREIVKAALAANAGGAIFVASTKAQNAADYLLNRSTGKPAVGVEALAEAA